MKYLLIIIAMFFFTISFGENGEKIGKGNTPNLDWEKKGVFEITSGAWGDATFEFKCKFNPFHFCIGGTNVIVPKIWTEENGWRTGEVEWLGIVEEEDGSESQTGVVIPVDDPPQGQ